MVTKDDIIAELRELVEKQAQQVDALTHVDRDCDLQETKTSSISYNPRSSPT